MSTPPSLEGLEERIAGLEQRLGPPAARSERADGTLDERLSDLEEAPRLRSRLAPTRGVGADLIPGKFATPPDERRPDVRTHGAESRTDDRRSAPSAQLSDVVGGRVLAWLGGIAVLVGIVFFLGLAISRGWIDEPGRVILAALGSAALMVAGVWLHNRRGRTEAAVSMVGTATAASFATLIVASQIYGLIPPLAAVAGSLAVGGLATRLAIRWAGLPIAAIGVVGALLSPVLVGADLDGGTIATLAVAAACAMWIVTRQGWRWLGLVTVGACAPQWGSWVLRQDSIAATLLVLAAFALIGLAGAVGAELSDDERRLRPSTAAILALNACAAALIGYFALRDAGGPVAAEAWLAGLAAVHAGVGLWRRVALSEPARQLLLTISVILADVAFALTASGIVLAAGWAATAVGFASLGRKAGERSGADVSEQTLLGLGMGAHVGLVLMRTLIEAPPDQLGSGDGALLPLLSVSVLIASSLGCARLTHARAPRVVLDGLGLLAVAYMTAAVVDGPALVAAWAFEGLALHQLARRSEEPTAEYGALPFFFAAIAHALVAEAPPAALVVGAADLGAAAIAVASVGLVALVAAHREAHPLVRCWLFGTGAVAAVYLASVAIVTAFQPAAGTANDAVLDLGVQQQGQVLLSALWGAVGLGTLIFALRKRMPSLVTGALALLLVTVAKVFLYDLSMLTSIYRVVSFVVLGLLLLAGAFTYQRLRPPSPPDMRRVHPSQR